MTVEKLTEIQQKMADVLRECAAECNLEDYMSNSGEANESTSISVDVTFFKSGDIRCATNIRGCNSKHSLETHRFEWKSVPLDNSDWEVFDLGTR